MFLLKHCYGLNIASYLTDTSSFVLANLISIFGVVAIIMLIVHIRAATNNYFISINLSINLND